MGQHFHGNELRFYSLWDGLHGDRLQVRVHSGSIGKAQKGLGRVADTGCHQSVVWGAADGVRNRLICELWVKVSQVTGASLRKKKKRLA